MKSLILETDSRYIEVCGLIGLVMSKDFSDKSKDNWNYGNTHLEISLEHDGSYKSLLFSIHPPLFFIKGTFLLSLHTVLTKILVSTLGVKNRHFI